MLNLLVAVDNSLPASIALRTACSLGSSVSIQPIYVYDAPGRDIEVGAGWARHSWGKEVSQLAQNNIENLVSAERNQCPKINDPVVLKGDPLTKIAEYFGENPFDLLVLGTPFRTLKSMELIRRFRVIVKKNKKELALLIVKQLKNIQQVVALTDGSNSAEKALGLLSKFVPFLSIKITLIGLPRADNPSQKTQILNLERGHAILQEKNIKAEGHILSELGYDKINENLAAADLLVCPVLTAGDDTFLQQIKIDTLSSGLFGIGQK